jgi:HEAT repeat protein
MIALEDPINQLVLRLKRNDNYPQDRITAQQQLLQYGPAITPMLFPYLDQNNIWILSAIIEILGEFRQKEVVPKIIPFLESRELIIIRKTVLALAKIGELSILPQIIKLLTHPSWHVKSCCAESLAIYYQNQELRNSVLSSFLTAYLQDNNREDYIVVRLSETEWDLDRLLTEPGSQITRILMKLEHEDISDLDWVLLTQFRALSLFLCESLLNHKNEISQIERIKKIHDKLFHYQKISLPSSLSIII